MSSAQNATKSQQSSQSRRNQRRRQPKPSPKVVKEAVKAIKKAEQVVAKSSTPVKFQRPPRRQTFPRQRYAPAPNYALHARDRAWNSMYRKLPVQFSRKIDEYVKSIVLPDKFMPNCVPLSIASDIADMTTTRLQTSFTLDVKKLAEDFAATTRPPILLTSGNSVPLWAHPDVATSIPIVQVQDCVAPLCMPMLSLPLTTGPDMYRLWQYPALTVMTGAMYPSNFDYGVPTVYSGELSYTAMGTMGTAKSVFPSGFTNRPIFVSRSIGTGAQQFENHIWIDACADFPTNVAVQGTITTSVNVEAGVSGELRVWLTRHSSDGLHTKIDDAAKMTIDVLGTSAVNLQTKVTNSGFYVVNYEISFFTTTNGTIYKVDSCQFESTLAVLELTDLGTAFYVNRTFASAMPTNATSYWPIGNAMLISFRSPELVCGGSVFAVNTSELGLSEWYQTSSASSETISSANLRFKYNAGQGGMLKRGLWTYCSPKTWFTRKLSVCDQRLTAYGTEYGTALSYWLGGSNAPSGNNLIWLSPALVSGDTAPTYVMQFTTYTSLVYVIRTQFISSRQLDVISSDELEQAYLLLALMTNFSENDWHSFFSKIVAAAKTVGGAIERGIGIATKAMPVVRDVAQKAVSIAGTVAEGAELLGALA